jgi:hypothetical protein
MTIIPLKGMVYVAGPMTLGVREDNIASAMTAGAELMKVGWAAFLPQLSYYLTDKYPFTWEEMLSYDFCIIESCIAIVRLPGESKGADEEEKFAKRLGIPVYYSVEAFLNNEN